MRRQGFGGGFGGGGGGGGGTNAATRDLANLTSPTAFNQHLLPGTDATFDVGSASKQVRNIYFSGSLIGGGTGPPSIEGAPGACTASGASNLKLCFSSTGNVPVISYNTGANVALIDKSIKFTKSFTILVPTAADTNLVQMAFAQAITIVRVYCSTDTGTATMNADERAESTPNTAGTDVLSAGIVCDSGTRTSCASGCDVNTITNGTIAANAPLNFQVTSVASAPQVVRFHVDYTLD
jgi:hypothetical protein